MTKYDMITLNTNSINIIWL